MGKITHPYVLLAFTAVVSIMLAWHTAQKRAAFSAVRGRQEEVLSQLMLAQEQASYLYGRRNELLYNPATIAEVAIEQYGFVPEGRLVADGRISDAGPEKLMPSVRIVETGWERFLGKGEYIWRIPVAATGFCAAVLGLLWCFDEKKGIPRS